MSEQSKAVFLSYASQDSEAAKRICEALHASGVARLGDRAAGERVWGATIELHGDSAWATRAFEWLDPRWEIFMRKLGLTDKQST
ncbi:MAG: hypothetical protein ABIZ04_07510 [Opitutus sp.]